MKTRYLVTIFVLLCLFGKLQSIHAQSDTINFASTTNTLFYLQNFDTVEAGKSECHTLYLQNSVGKPLIINSVIGDQYNNGILTAKAVPTLPTILLPGEIVSIADLCYSPTAGNGPDSGGANYLYMTIGYSIGSNTGQLSGSMLGFRKVDTLLKKQCVSTSMDADIFGPILMDGDVSHTVTITSNRRTPIVVSRSLNDEYGYDNSSFAISGITFPYTLSAQETKTFTITYSPRSNIPNVTYRAVGRLAWAANDGNQVCSQGYLTLPGVAIPPTDPTTSTSLAAGSTDVLAMISDNSVTTQTFNFKNNGTTNLKITNVSLKNGKSFAITDIQPTNTLPFILTPGQSMSVTVAMTTVTNGVYYDEVIITAENGFISMDFPLQGLRKNGIQAAVKTISNDERFAIYPNPSHGEITVDLPGISNAKIEVLDLLGRVITKETASEKWIWKSNQPAGTYILHISGTDESGKTIQSYDRFIIE